MTEQEADVALARVTIVDDDGDILDVFRAVLEEVGFEVTTHSDALPGVHEIIRSRPDLVIVDLELAQEREQLTGLQLIHAARTSVELRDIPIIVCSGDLFALKQAWPGLMERGDVHQLEKPFDLRTLERVVAMALGQPLGAGGQHLEAGAVVGDDAEMESEA